MIVPGSGFVVVSGFNDGCGDPLTDAHWSSVELLCWADGSDDGTTFTDETGNYSITNNSSLVKTKTAVKKFGTASAYFPGNSSQRLLAGSTSDWKFLHDGTTDFTVEFWLSTVHDRVVFFSTCAGGTPDVGVYFYLDNGGHVLGLQIMRGVSGSPTVALANVSFGSLTDGVFRHVVFQFDSSETDSYQIFVGGVLRASKAATTAHSSANSMYALSIGGDVGEGLYGGYYYNPCYMDDIRITKGVARYPASGFTPPCRRFPNS